MARWSEQSLGLAGPRPAEDLQLLALERDRVQKEAFELRSPSSYQAIKPSTCTSSSRLRCFTLDNGFDAPIIGAERDARVSIVPPVTRTCDTGGPQLTTHLM